METDAAEHTWERYFFPNHCQRFGWFSLGEKAHVAGHVYSCRASMGTRYKCGFTFCPLNVEIEQGACGADLNARTAELTPGLLQGTGDSPCYDFTVTTDETERPDTSQVPAHPDASRAADTQIVVLSKQGLVFLSGQTSVNVSGGICFDPYERSYRLKLAVTEL